MKRGKQKRFQDDEPIEIILTDSPMLRICRGVSDACAAMPLSELEIRTLTHFLLCYEHSIEGAPARAFLPILRPGVVALIERGWMVRKRGVVHVYNRPEMQAIIQTVESYMLRGPAQEGHA